jgi:hypothetical protein
MTAGLAIGPNALRPWIGVYCVGAIVVFASASLTTRMWKSASAALAVLAASLVISRPYPSLQQGQAEVIEVAEVQLENVTIDSYIKETRAMQAGVENDVIQTVVIDVAKSDPMPVDPTVAFVNDPRLEDRFALLVLSQLVGHGRMRLIP